jgi:hypothetical protein
LIVGMGEDWWSNGGPGQQEIAIDNISLYISDASESVPTPQPPAPTPSQQSSQNNIAPPSTQTPTTTPPHSDPTSKASATPTLQAKPTPTIDPVTGPTDSVIKIWVAVPLVALLIAIVVAVFWIRKKLG